MRTLILIPARGGSKGLPGKNLKLVGGVPLIGRTAIVARHAAKDLGPDCRVVCSTDDEIIAQAARAWGAETPFIRPASLATDAAVTIDVILHALDALSPTTFDRLVLLQATCPFTTATDVLEAVALSLKTRAAVVSVSPLEHPAAWQFTMEADGRLRKYETLAAPPQRQQAETVFRLNGAIYVAEPEYLRKSRSFLGPQTYGFVMPLERSVDIDTELDLKLARLLAFDQHSSTICLGNRTIGTGHPCFIIAEAGVNHNGDLGLAKQLVDTAVEAKADAVKFQTFKAERLATLKAPKAEYQKQTAGSQESQVEMLRRLELGEAAHRELLAYCRDREIVFLSSPFDEDSADFLESLDVPAFKIPSGEVTNLPFLAHIALKCRPIILSTGMSTMREVDEALQIIRRSGNPPVVVLHCVSNYPALASDVNLRAMLTMADTLGVLVGYSDHTSGIEIALAAAALGACVIEKHFTLDRELPGPDHKASLERDELAAMVCGIRNVEVALGHGRKEPAASERNVAEVARKSLVAACDVPAGAVLTADLVAIRRPGTGLPPAMLHHVLGRCVRSDLSAGALLTLDQLQ